MREYLQMILIIPGTVFFFLKWTAILWGPIFFLTPFIYKKFKNIDFPFKVKFLKIALFSLYCVTRFLMSSSNLPSNNSSVYQVNMLEASSFIFTILYAAFFFLDQKRYFFKRSMNDNSSVFLGTLILSEGIINVINLYLSGYGVSFLN